MRRRKAVPRTVTPDTRHNSVLVARLINKVMMQGKKSVAERIVYQAMDMTEKETKKPALDALEQAIRNVTPLLEVKPRRVGGATYQVPVEIRPERRLALAIRWLLGGARARTGKPMAQRLAAEITDAARGQGSAIKRREDLHKMAEANRAFVHYRW
ncbi:MAG: 30S ribosomal protein S7 [Dehalococcoidia bacterium]|nr:30S ribosomal protein S7 [Dehalococcoidia bacterium]